MDEPQFYEVLEPLLGRDRRHLGDDFQWSIFAKSACARTPPSEYLGGTPTFPVLAKVAESASQRINRNRRKTLPASNFEFLEAHT